MRDLKLAFIIFLTIMAPHNPTLKHFLLRAQALTLYRNALRASRGMNIFELHGQNDCMLSAVIGDANTRQETIRWIRGEFERNKYIEDVVYCCLIIVPKLEAHLIFRS
jgi:hypothetical protein